MNATWWAWFPWLLAGFLLVVLGLQVMLYVSAVVELVRVRRRDRHRLWRRVLCSPLAPRVSVLVPAYDEELTIRDSVAGILSLTYPNLEVVVVDDGSSDATTEVLIAAFDLVAVHPIFRRRGRPRRCRPSTGPAPSSGWWWCARTTVARPMRSTARSTWPPATSCVPSMPTPSSHPMRSNSWCRPSSTTPTRWPWGAPCAW